MLIDGDYIIRRVAGRILSAMLAEYQRSGRVRFSNRELRLDRDIGLPAVTLTRAPASADGSTDIVAFIQFPDVAAAAGFLDNPGLAEAMKAGRGAGPASAAPII